MALILGNGGPSLLEASRIRSCKCSSSSSYGRTQLKMEMGYSFNTHQSPCLRPQSYPWRQFNLSTKSRRPKSRSIFVSHIVAAMQQVEETYIMVKPDGVQRGLVLILQLALRFSCVFFCGFCLFFSNFVFFEKVGEIISRFEKKGFLLKGLKMFNCPKELAEEHYKDLKARSFFPGLVDYITSGPVVCMAWEGVGVVASARKLIGVTNPLLAEPGTIRGDLAINTGRNVIHGSDSPENGSREIALWFKEGEICHWTQAQSLWLSSDE